MADLNNNDYLRFDAASMQHLLRRKLTEQGYYTDQMYPGSNIKMIMDIVSWMFDCLTYMLNNSAAESMFDSAVAFEHINKLAKVLSYKPRGYITSCCAFSINGNNNSGDLYSGVLTIPKFTSLVIGGSDRYGYPLKYTFMEDFQCKIEDGVVNLNSNEYPILYNGSICKYSKTLTASGIANERFTIDLTTDLMYSSSSANAPHLIVDDQVFVYLQHINPNTNEATYTELTRVDDLYFEGSATEYNYELVLNEYKQYVIKFGDGIHGKILPEGDSLIVLFLQSNGEDGVIDSGFVADQSSVELTVIGMADDDLINVVFGGINAFKTLYSDMFILNDSFINNTDLIVLSNIEQSSTPQECEDVASIRENAPHAFAMGHRLLTTEDFTTFVKNNLKNEVSSVFTMNNVEYTMSFLKWLHLYDCLNVSVVKNNYKFSDACDFNNIYVWVKGRTKNKLSTNQLQQIVNICDRRKVATSNVVPCNGIACLFLPFVDSNSNPFDYKEMYDANWEEKMKLLKIRIIKQRGVYVTNTSIKNQVAAIINDYFKVENTTLGQCVDLNVMYKKIIAIPGVQSVKTINDYLGTEAEGLSFACFSSTVIDGQDFNIFTDSKQLLKFQYPQLFQTDISKYIEISDTL